MASAELKYWVFHQEALDQQLDAYVAERIAQGGSQADARVEAHAIRWFLTESTAGKPLLGGRAG